MLLANWFEDAVGKFFLLVILTGWALGVLARSANGNGAVTKAAKFGFITLLKRWK